MTESIGRNITVSTPNYKQYRSVYPYCLLLQDKASQYLINLTRTNEDIECQWYAVLCAGNLAIMKSTHAQFIQSGI